MKIRYAKMSEAFKIKFFVGAAVVLMFSLIGMVMFNFNDAEYVVTVTGRERIMEPSQGSEGNTKISSKYLVYADDQNGDSLVFENTDCSIRGKFNSSNIQGQLKEGHTYRITVVGYRILFLSWYQNIIKVKKVGKGEMNRKETTDFLGKLLVSDRFSGPWKYKGKEFIVTAGPSVGLWNNVRMAEWL